MLEEVLNSNSILRLKGLLNNRYGMGLKINMLMDATSLNIRSQSPSLYEGDLRIPIIARDKYMATAIVPGANSLTATDHTAIAEMVRLVLEPALYSWHLKQTEFNSQLNKTEETLSNIGVPDQILEEEVSSRLLFSTSLFLLESSNPHLIPRAAVQIHEIGERWAYLKYSDIRSQITCGKDLQELGSMTILVEDILQLSPAEQALLADFAQQADTQTEPLILVGSTTRIDDLAERDMVDLRLLEHLQLHRLDLDRMPKNFGLMRDTLELILDRKGLLN